MKVKYYKIFLVLFLSINTNISKVFAQDDEIFTLNNKVVFTMGLGSDNNKIISFLKENPIWYQGTENETVRIEFIGFEKENSISKLFNFGINKPTPNNPVLGLVFHKKYDPLREVLDFGDFGEVSVTHLNSPPIKGTYNYIEIEKKLYVNFDNDSRVYTIENKNGKNLGFSGEDLPDVRLHDLQNKEEFVLQGTSDEGSYKKPVVHNWFFPENRYLFRYVISHNKYVNENGNQVYKRAIECKYGAIIDIKITDRVKPINYPNDPYNIYLKDTNNNWKYVELIVAVSLNFNDIKFQKYMPNYIETHPIDGLGITSLYLCNDCPTTDPSPKFKSFKNPIKLFINNVINNAGSGYDNKSFELLENYYLTPNAGYTKRKINDEIGDNCYVAYLDETGKHGLFWTRMMYDSSPQQAITHEFATTSLAQTVTRLPTIAEMKMIYKFKNQIFKNPELAVEEVWTEDPYYGTVDFITNGKPIFNTFRLSDGVILQRPSDFPASMLPVSSF